MMPSHCKRKSRSPSHHSHDRDLLSNSPKHHRSKANNKLESILKSFDTLKNDVSNCNSCLALYESHLEQQKMAFKPDHEVDCDAISLLVSEDPAFKSVNGDEVFQPSAEAELLPNEATTPPNTAIKPPNKAFEPPNKAIKPPNDTSSAGDTKCGIK